MTIISITQESNKARISMNTAADIYNEIINICCFVAGENKASKKRNKNKNKKK